MSAWGLFSMFLSKKDLRTALRYYDSAGGTRLGDRFFEEVEAALERVSKNPKRYHFVADGLRRASLHSFPYHFVYEENEERIHFLVLRHNKQHPAFGLKRRR